MRLFAAVDPPDDVRTALDAAVGPREAELRWVPVEQWHLTLAFYGEVPEGRVADLTARLERAAARTPPFTLRLAGTGTFPADAARARQLWIGVEGDRDTLTRLAASCAAAGRRIGQPMEDRGYRPHLTLARGRRGAVDARPRVSGLAAFAGQEWTVAEVTLVHSTLGRTVVHRPLAALRLGPK